jgi:allantoicase
MTTDFTDLPDLAAEGLGGAALLANDEFFAEKDNLLKSHEAEWRDHAYTDRGKWMDGWETRRRREPGHDWCIVRLGLPGVVRGVVIDTRWFRGNFPAEAALDVAALEPPFDLASLPDAEWTELLPRSTLAGDSKNRFAVNGELRATHVRLRIFPDGGVARLRVHGEVAPDWGRILRLGGPVDLAALENGGRVLSCSDMFFGSRGNLVKPGRAVNMADGWETRRRRGPGHDWAVVRLGTRGIVRRVEVDTTHFRGNAPGRCTLELAHSAIDEVDDWRPVLATPLQPHTRHLFDAELRRTGPATHARLSLFPDGGVARLRLWGEPLVEAPAGLVRLNEAAVDEAWGALRAVCGSRRWVERLVVARPFEDLAALVRIGERAWWSLGEDDWLEAFAAHPRIGQPALAGPESGDPGARRSRATWSPGPESAGESTTTSAARWSGGEQSGVGGATAEVLGELAAKNQDYEERHGFIFIVCATGRSAPEMLGYLDARLPRGRDEELRTAAEEQAKIIELRLRKLVHS